MSNYYDINFKRLALLLLLLPTFMRRRMFGALTRALGKIRIQGSAMLGEWVWAWEEVMTSQLFITSGGCYWRQLYPQRGCKLWMVYREQTLVSNYKSCERSGRHNEHTITAGSNAAQGAATSQRTGTIVFKSVQGAAAPLTISQAGELGIGSKIWLLPPSADAPQEPPLQETRVQSIWRIAAQEVIVYNIEVEDAHNYFVVPPGTERLSGYYTKEEVNNAIETEAQARTQGDADVLAAASEYADSRVGTLIVRSVPQPPSPQAGAQYYNHFIWTPAVSGADGTWSVVQNQAIERLSGELFCLGVYAATAAVGITLAVKKAGTSWFLAGVNGFIYRNAPSVASVKMNIGFELKANGSLSGYTNQWAFYEINQTNAYPRLLSGASFGAYDVPLSTSGGANVQFFCVNNIQP